MKEKILNNLKKIISENFKFWEVIILMGLTAVVGISVGSFITKNNYGLSFGKELSPSLQEFLNNYNYISNNYYGEFNEEELLNKALQKILEEIDDPYAAYMDETESSNFDIQLSGSYRGIGIEVANLLSTDQLIITGVFNDSPAEKAGLQVGDVILKMNGDSTNEMSTSDFSHKIKEVSGSFMLTVKRNDEEIDLEVTADTVIIQSVTSNMINGSIGYVHISIFADNTYEQLKSALKDLNTAGMDSLIIDVRSNTGGYLSSVEKILGLFLDETHVIYQIEDKTGVKKYYSNGNQTVDYEIVVLTNEATASASEILTAALKEELGAKTVGKKTYGKGLAQKLHTLSDGSKYKFTTQKWLTPSGLSIDQQGIEVDYEIELGDTFLNNPTVENDNQLQCAIDILTK